MLLFCFLFFRLETAGSVRSKRHKIDAGTETFFIYKNKNRERSEP